MERPVEKPLPMIIKTWCKAERSGRSNALAEGGSSPSKPFATMSPTTQRPWTSIASSMDVKGRAHYARCRSGLAGYCGDDLEARPIETAL